MFKPLETTYSDPRQYAVDTVCASAHGPYSQDRSPVAPSSHTATAWCCPDPELHTVLTDKFRESIVSLQFSGLAVAVPVLSEATMVERNATATRAKADLAVMDSLLRAVPRFSIKFESSPEISWSQV
ncbi:hypothetical protein [Nocardia tenerifensis]|uniref:hypothetical protein n=1 Tax=Nocardia tenerifensis TaxID=228006 RepID=UPI00059404D9|nr:hypothetical protein [Nocardia tenerifensis]